VEEGAYVKAGQPLFKIDDRPYVEQVNTANANLNAALAVQKNAKLEVEKYTLLNRNNVTSDFQLKTAQSQYEAAQANVAQQEAVLKTAKINLGFTLIKSPVSGFIGRIPKRIGNLASAADMQPLTTLSEISDVYAYFSITEKEFLRFNTRYEGNTLAKKITATDSVLLKLADDSEYPCKGKIQMINGEFDAATGAINVRAIFPNPQHLLRTGNTGRIVLPYTEQQVLLIPVLSTLDIQNKVFVIRLDEENKSERVPITISNKQGDYYIVKSGLRFGDRIVSRDLEMIEEGTVIQPQ
jgi:membrane fusion protein (multidrug efflux system)